MRLYSRLKFLSSIVLVWKATWNTRRQRLQISSVGGSSLPSSCETACEWRPGVGGFATNAIKLDDTSRIRLGMLPLGDYSEPDGLSADEIRLKKVPTPEARKRMTFTEAMRSIETRGLRFTTSWDELRKETRE